MNLNVNKKEIEVKLDKFLTHIGFKRDRLITTLVCEAKIQLK